jgi:hypothetical protein
MAWGDAPDRMRKQDSLDSGDDEGVSAMTAQRRVKKANEKPKPGRLQFRASFRSPSLVWRVARRGPWT